MTPPIIRIIFANVALIVAISTVSGCSTSPTISHKNSTSTLAPSPAHVPAPSARADVSNRAVSIVLYALMLRDTGYQFGGKNPKVGLDCSGMVTYVYKNAAGMTLNGNAAALARQGNVVSQTDLRVGDLVFFNTLRRAYSHVGIYIGNGEFIHALNARAGIRVDKLSNTYYAKRFDTARTFFS